MGSQARDRFKTSKETKLGFKTQPKLSTTQSTEYGNMKMHLSSSDSKLFRCLLREYMYIYTHVLQYVFINQDQVGKINDSFVVSPTP